MKRTELPMNNKKDPLLKYKLLVAGLAVILAALIVVFIIVAVNR